MTSVSVAPARGAEVLWIEDVPKAITGAMLRLEVELRRGVVERVGYFSDAQRALECNDYQFLVVDLRLPVEPRSSHNLVLDAGEKLLLSLKRGDYGSRNVNVPFAVYTAMEGN